MIDKRKIFELYKEAPFLMRAYLRIKLRICPLIALEDFFPKGGRIVDLGCGSGLFSNILSLGSPDRWIFGLDLDEKKIGIANQTKAQGSHMTYQAGDIVETNYPEGDVFSLVDVLYLIPYEKQERIFKKCYFSLSENGILFIKEMDAKPRWKHIWNLLQESLAVKMIGFTLSEKRERFFFRSQEDYLKILRKIGFSVKAVPMHSGYWYPHIAYICRK